MTRAKLINAFNLLAEAAATVAIELEASEAPQTERALPPVAASAGGSSVSAPPAAKPVDTGACPKHGVPWEQGNFGPYCKQLTDDPAWGKAKTDRDGNPVMWCRLTPKNAPDWVRVNGLPA